jgi:hypothetical protein
MERLTRQQLMRLEIQLSVLTHCQGHTG